jgi:hypothetical protein
VYENTKEDLKKHKKIIQEQTRALEEVERNQNVASGRQSRAGMEAQAEIERLKRELEDERESNAQLKGERDELADQLEAAHTRASAKDADTENLENEIDLLEMVG